MAAGGESVLPEGITEDRDAQHNDNMQQLLRGSHLTGVRLWLQLANSGAVLLLSRLYHFPKGLAGVL